MAVHYYDEDELEIGTPVTCHVVSNHITELSEEEKWEAREEAKQIFIEKERARLSKKPVKKTEAPQVQQSSLF